MTQAADFHRANALSMSKIYKKRNLLLALLIFVSAFASCTLSAQVGGNLNGVVKDSTGAVVINASVLVTNIHNGEAQTLKSGSEGEFRAVNLQPSVYQVTVTSAGFGVTKKTVEVLVGSDQAIEVGLGAPGTSEVINISSDADNTIDTTQSQPAAVIDNKQLAVLPVLNRNFLAIAQTMPGAAPVAAMAITTKFALTKFGGLADQRNGYTTIIDGAPIDDSTWGTPVINMSQDAIQEFKLYNNQFDAQYGHALNAVINVVTLSGGDKYHGTGYYFGRDASLNATNAMATTKPPYSLLRTGGTLGGPVPKLKGTHVFGSFEYVRINSAQITALGTANPFATIQNGNYAYTQWERIGDVKVDHTFNDRHRIYGRYAYDHQFLPNGGPVNSANTTTDNSIAHSLVLEDDYVLSSHMTNTLRYEYLNHNLYSLPANFDTEVIRPSYSFGQNPTLPQYFPRTNNAIADTFFINAGKHDIKIGAEVTKVYSTYQSHYFEHGQFTFTTDKPFVASDSSTWPQSFVQQTNGNYFYRQLQYSGFIQDDWKALPHLHLNLGLRYDFNSNLRNNKFYNSLLANPFFAGINNFVSPSRGTDWAGGIQPRIGFVYDVGGNGKLVVRGGFGLYYSRMRPYWGLQDQTQTLGASVRITDQSQLKNYPDITAVLGGKTLDQYVNSGGARAAVILANDFSLPYSENFSGGIGWQIDARSSLNVDVIHDHAIKEIGTHDVNLPATGAVTTANPRPVARFGTFGVVFNNGQSRYDALQLQFRTRPSKYLDSVQISYAYSKSIIDAVTYYSTYVGTQRTPNNYSYNPTDTPNNLSIALASKTLPGKFRISSIFRGLSGSPFATSAGVDLDGDTTITNDRPRGLPQYVGRGDIKGQVALINAYRANPCSFLYYNPTSCPVTNAPVIGTQQILPDSTLTWDARVTRPIRIREGVNVELFFEGFNLSNHVTRFAPTTTMNSAAYMVRTTALDPRQLQWGARITY